MSQDAQVIELLTDTNGSFIHDKALADSGTAIIPGHLVVETATGVREHAVAATNAQKLFALTNLSVGGTIDDVYAVGETVRYGAAHSGQKVFALVAAGATSIPKGAALESAGNGTLRLITISASTAALARDSIVAYAREAVDNSGGGSVVRIKARVA